jgi:HK97 family phage portal protein
MGFFDTTLKQYGYERQEQKSGTPPAIQEKDYSTAPGALGSIVGAGARTPGFSSFNGEKQQLQAYRDWVYIAAGAVAEQCASVDLRLFENHTKVNNATLGLKLIENPQKAAEYMDQRVNYYETKNGIMTYRKNVKGLQELDVNPLLALMNVPNPSMVKNEFLEITFLHLELTGNAYWFIARNKKGQPVELWPLMPHQMAVVPDETHFIIGYVYTNNGKQIPLDPEDVIHHKYGNPMDLRHGYSAVAAGATTIDADSHAGIFNDNFFRNSAMPDGFLTTEESLDEKTFKRLKTEWMNNYSGPSNAHRTAILSGGLEYKNLQIPQRDMEFLKGRNFNRDMIMALFGVPKSILGFDESMSRANADTAEYVFSKRIRIKLQRLTNRITMDLAPQFGKSLIMSFTDPVPRDAAQVLSDQTTSLGGTNTIGMNTINEVRAKRGDLPIPGGDDIFIPMNMQPLGKANFELTPEGTPADAVEEEDESKPEENDDTTNNNTEPDAPSPASAPGSGVSDGGSTTSSTTNSNRGVEKPQQKTLEEFPTSVLAIKGEDKETPFLDAEPIKEAVSPKPPAYTRLFTDKNAIGDYLAQREHQGQVFQMRFMKIAKDRFNQQKSEVLYTVNSRFLLGAKSVQGLVKKDAKKQLDNLFVATASVAAWNVGLIPVFKGATMAGGNLGAALLNDPQQYGYNAPAPEIAVDYSSVSAQVDKYFAEHSDTISKGIDAETDKQLRSILTEKINAGASLQEMSDAVENVYSAASGYRALRIAITESQRSLQYANNAIWQDSGMIENYSWIIGGNNPCILCIDRSNEPPKPLATDWPDDHPSGQCSVIPNQLKSLADVTNLSG